MALPAGIWLSFIAKLPKPFPSFPNDGIVIFDEPDAVTHAIEGDHFRPLKSHANGRFTPASGGNPDHITFSEPAPTPGCIYIYDGDVVETKPNHFEIQNGKRSLHCFPLKPGEPVEADGDDDWVGTHTT